MSKVNELFSADEMKTSALIVSLIGWILVGIYKYMTIGEVSSNYVAVAGLLVSAIAGINILKKETQAQVVNPIIPEPVPYEQTNKLF